MSQINFKGVRIDEKDTKWFSEAGDPDFSAARNKEIIAGTIKKYEANRIRKMQEWRRGFAERTDAAATYLKSLSDGRTTDSVQQYFGQRELARLRGEQIMDVIQRSAQDLGIEES